MLVPVTEISVKTENLNDINKVMEKVKDIQEDNPDRLINVAIEITLKDVY